MDKNIESSKKLKDVAPDDELVYELNDYQTSPIHSSDPSMISSRLGEHEFFIKPEILDDPVQQFRASSGAMRAFVKELENPNEGESFSNDGISSATAQKKSPHLLRSWFFLPLICLVALLLAFYLR